MAKASPEKMIDLGKGMGRMAVASNMALFWLVLSIWEAV